MGLPVCFWGGRARAQGGRQSEAQKHTWCVAPKATEENRVCRDVRGVGGCEVRNDSGENLNKMMKLKFSSLTILGSRGAPCWVLFPPAVASWEAHFPDQSTVYEAWRWDREGLRAAVMGMFNIINIFARFVSIIYCIHFTKSLWIFHDKTLATTTCPLCAHTRRNFSTHPTNPEANPKTYMTVWWCCVGKSLFSDSFCISKTHPYTPHIFSVPWAHGGPSVTKLHRPQQRTLGPAWW